LSINSEISPGKKTVLLSIECMLLTKTKTRKKISKRKKKKRKKMLVHSKQQRRQENRRVPEDPKRGTSGRFRTPGPFTVWISNFKKSVIHGGTVDMG
jgi:hypothetical protein